MEGLMAERRSEYSLTVSFLQRNGYEITRDEQETVGEKPVKSQRNRK